jgi:hypothetical protein
MFRSGAHLLGDEVARQPDDERVHVVRSAHEAVHRDVDLDDVREVGERVELDEFVALGGQPRGAVPAGQFQHGVDRGCTLQVDVQFGLRKAGDEGALRVGRHATVSPARGRSWSGCARSAGDDPGRGA